MFTKILKEKAAEKPEAQVKVHCKDCGLVFLDIDITSYTKLSHHCLDGTPDRWFVETGIHWNLTDHDIELFIEDPAEYSDSISDIWEKKKVNDKLDHDLMLQGFYKFKELCKGKPI
jgi:hypothetical protein